MNVEERIQRLERQNNRLKVTLIGMGITVLFTVIFVLDSRIAPSEEKGVKIKAHPHVVVEKDETLVEGDTLAGEGAEIVRTKKVEFIDDDGQVIAALGSNEGGDGLVMTYNNTGVSLAQLHAIFSEDGLVAVYNVDGQRLIMVEAFEGNHDGISLTNGKSLALVAGQLLP